MGTLTSETAGSVINGTVGIFPFNGFTETLSFRIILICFPRENLQALATLLAKRDHPPQLDRKSTRLNSSHTVISYAVFCLKKKKKNTDIKRLHKSDKQVNEKRERESNRLDTRPQHGRLTTI